MAAKTAALSTIISTDKPVYTLKAVSKDGTRVKFSSSKGGEKEFSKSWLTKMVNDGNAVVDGDTIIFQPVEQETEWIEA